MIRNIRLIMADLTQMKILVLASDLGSLAAVARKLGVSPAAISKQVTRLEKELGLELIVRSTRKLAFTDVGTDYCHQCRRILEEVEAANALASQLKAVPSGSLKVVSGRHFGSTYIVPHIQEFLLTYPKIELNLELAERIPDINAEGIDVVIGMSVSASGDVIQKRIATTTYTYCASPSYLKKYGTPKKPEDLTKHRFITHSMRKPDNVLEFGSKSIMVHPYIRVNDVQTMVDFAEAGLGIVRLHHYVVKEHLERGTLQELFKSYTTTEIPIYVAYPERRFIASKIRVFIDFMTGKLKT